MTTNQYSNLADELPSEVKPYVKAMLRASGLSEFDAITSVLFAIATQLNLNQYPILVYFGARGTGKSAAMKQLFQMCKESKWIQGRTPATQRIALNEVRTAFLDEADIVDHSSELTALYTCRYLRETGTIEANVRQPFGLWGMQKFNIFGATVMAKRTPLADVALRSRAIIIHTTYQLREYGYTKVGEMSRIASSIAVGVKHTLSEIGEIDRVYQTWSSLLAIAQEFDMNDWRSKAITIQVREAEALAGGQGYEPSEAILQAIDILARDEVSHKRMDKSVRISDVVRLVREEFALSLKGNQIREEAEVKGFPIGKLNGYPVIKVKKDRLDALLPE